MHGTVHFAMACRTAFKQSTRTNPRWCQKSPKNIIPELVLCACACTVSSTCRHVVSVVGMTCRSEKSTHWLYCEWQLAIWSRVSLDIVVWIWCSMTWDDCVMDCNIASRSTIFAVISGSGSSLSTMLDDCGRCTAFVESTDLFDCRCDPRRFSILESFMLTTVYHPPRFCSILPVTNVASSSSTTITSSPTSK